MDQPYRFFVGVDWAWKEHSVCIIDQQAQILHQSVVAHSGAGMMELRELLGKLEGSPGSVAVAIETPRGAVVESLLESNYAVFSLNPKQMDRFRDRHTVAGAKDDRRDAFVQADSLRTDRHLFRKVRLDAAVLLNLRELSRAEEDLQQDRLRAQNQLAALLNRYFPRLLDFSPAADEPWLWDLLEKTALPQAAARRSKNQWATLLRSYRIRRFDAQTLWQALQEPVLPLAPGAAEAARDHVNLLLPKLRLLHRQGREVAQRMTDLLQEMSEDPDCSVHRDAKILLSLPGVGRVVGATVLAEASQALADRDYHALRSFAGSAPVTHQSGGRKTVQMRRACNPRLRKALYHWAMISSCHDPRSQQHYLRLRGKGHSHGRALRGLADRLLAVLIAMLRSGTLYDPQRRAAITSATA